MTGEEATVAVIEALETLGTPYMLVGSFASNFYGIPRFTQDADLVVQFEKGGLGALGQRLGSRFRLDPQVSFEAITGTTRYLFNLADSGFRIEFFVLSNDPHDLERFRRRQRVQLFGHDTFLPTAEDVIVTKLRWFHAGHRAKDMDDVRAVIAVQADRIAWDYVTAWCDRHGTRELLEQIRKSVPPL